jgi:hypothetical protein
MQTTVIEIEWDGTHLPKELEQLPPGRYQLFVADDTMELSEEEEAAIRAGLDDVAAGRVRPLDDAIRDIRARLRRA